MAGNREEKQRHHWRLATRMIHFGGEVDEHTGAASVPIYQASTYHHHSLDHPPKFDYARSGNPTRQALEDYIAQLEGGVRGFAFSSGMAAISTVFMLFSAGDHIICTEDVYGGTYRLLADILTRMNIETTFVDMTDPEKVRRALKPNTKALYMETPSNPILKITDIAEMTSWAKSKGLLTLIDNTFMTPFFQRPLELGVDIVLHSGTKFLGGHSDVVAGLAVVADKSLGQKIKQLQNGLGTILGMQDSWLLMRGMKTLKPRMEYSEKSAMRLAQWLKQHPRVEKVYYPGLEDHPRREIHEKQSSGYGAVVSFDLGSQKLARQVMERVRIPLVAVSLGAVESILSYPAMMSHAAMPKEVREKLGVTDGLLRFSVGLEDVEDLIEDLDEALRV